MSECVEEPRRPMTGEKPSEPTEVTDGRLQSLSASDTFESTRTVRPRMVLSLLPLLRPSRMLPRTVEP